VSLINAAYQVEEFFVGGPRTTATEVTEHLLSGVFLIAEEEGRRFAACVYVFPFYTRLGYAFEGQAPFPEGLVTRLPCRFLVMSRILD
jgi:hypothetical protein